MQKLVISALVLGAMTSVAMAEELKLTATQMDQIAAGTCVVAGICLQAQIQPQFAAAGQFAGGGCNGGACNAFGASAGNGNATNLTNVANNLGVQIQ